MHYGQMRFLLFVASLYCLPALADSEAEFSAFVEAELTRFNVTGASIAVIDRGVVRYLNFGHRAAGNPALIVSSDLFHIASISKPITAWGLMKLNEINSISLDEPVSTYLKTWQLPPSNYNSEKVTLRRIMSHTAGLSARSYQGFPPSIPQPTLIESLNGIPLASSAVFLKDEPGTSYRYSGGGYTLAQLLIENVTDKRFQKYMEEVLFRPLNMQHATFEPADPIDDNAVKPHDFSGRTVDNFVLPELAAGGLRASAIDLTRFAFANMRANPVLTSKSTNQLHERVNLNGTKTTATLGFERRNGLIGHGGQNRGWNSWIDIDPAQQSALIVLTNSDGGLRAITSIRCKWNDLFSINKMDDYCNEELASRQETRTILLIASAISLLLALLILSNLFKKIRESKIEFRLSIQRALLSMLCLSAIGLLWLVIGTDLGVYLGAGIKWGYPTIEYLPPATWYLAFGLTFLLAAIASRISFKRISV